MAASVSLAARHKFSQRKVEGYLFWLILIPNNNAVSFQKEDNSVLATWLWTEQGRK